VFSHALFEHLADPIRGVTEIRRVLRRDGVAGLCSPDWGGFILSPSDDAVETAIARYRMIQERNGGQTRAGRQLVSWLAAGGLVPEKIQARYECYPDSRVIVEYLALQLEQTGDTESGSVLRYGQDCLQRKVFVAARGDAQITNFQGLRDCQQAPGTLRKHPDAKAGIYSDACKP
jgi:hypothetical protein